MICARCHNEYFDKGEKFSLCRECWDEVGMLGDSESYKMWRGVSILINTPLSMDDMKELADSTSFLIFVSEVLNEMDIEMRQRYLLKEIKKVV